MDKAPEFASREDKLKPWLKDEIKDFMFDEFSTDYISRTGQEFLLGVDMPLLAEDLVSFNSDKGLDVTKLADNMITIIGADVHFRFNGAYLKYLALYFNEDLIKVVLQKAWNELQNKHYIKSCIAYRAALMLDGSDKAAMFGYAACCREWYLSLEGDDDQKLVSVLKQESTEYFEWCVMLHPDFSDPYYYLGYAYLNSGQYKKADLIWKEYVELAKDSKSKDDIDAVSEIKERREALVEPVKIEGGINLLLEGKLEEGLHILEPYTDTEYNTWWPLHWYLASAYRMLGYTEEAIEGFRKVIELAPSNIAANEALAELYAKQGNADMSEKYAGKAKLLKKNA